MVCCCSLAGTAACKYCFNNLNLTNTKSNYIIITPELDKVYPTVQYWCNNCDSVLTPYQKYCHNCGKEIDWSEIFKNE